MAATPIDTVTVTVTAFMAPCDQTPCDQERKCDRAPTARNPARASSAVGPAVADVGDFGGVVPAFGDLRHHQQQVRAPVPCRTAAEDGPGTGVTTTRSSLFDDYFDTLVRGDAVAATDLVMDLLDAGASLSEIVQDVMAPAQKRVGELWERGEWSVAQEHTATAVTEVAVSALWVMTARRQLRGGPRVAVACAEGEWHALPPRMTAALAAEAGADVTVLGPSMPADHLQRRLAVGDIDVLALSCTVPVSLLGAQRCVAAGHAAGLPVVVGGRAFAGRQQRARAIGADLLTDDPAKLCQLPPAAGEDVVVPEEALRLEAVPDAIVGDLLDRVVAAFPSLAAAPSRLRDRTREDLRWIVRFTGAAVLTDDPTVLDDFLASLLRMLHGRVPDEVVLGGADVVADGIGPLVPHGAGVLRDAVRRARESI